MEKTVFKNYRFFSGRRIYRLFVFQKFNGPSFIQITIDRLF